MKYAFLICLLLCPTLILQAQKGKSSLRSQADRALSERKYEEAIAKYTALIDKLPRDPYAYIGRAKAFQGLRDCESSIRDCRSSLALNPRNVDAYTVLGNCFNNSSKYDSALKAFRSAIMIDSSVAMSWSCLGMVEYNMGRRVEAIRSKTRAWLLDTADMEMLVSRADYRYYADSFLLAKQDYERALLSNRGLSHARYGRARCCSAMGLYSEAITDYGIALALDTSLANRTRALRGRAEAYVETGMYRLAIADYTTLIKMDSRDREAYHGRGLAKLKSKDSAGACSDWSVARDLGKYSSEYKRHCR